MNCYRCDTPVPDDSHYCQACGADVSGGGAGRAAVEQRDPELEERLAAEVAGEFVIERVLGRGGMGLVFLARDLQLNRKVAIKVLPPELTYGPGMVERFKREARTAATLDHPHIVPIYRISKTGKLVWFAMKYVEGESLADLLDREKSLPPVRSVEILTQIAEGLDFAHQRGVIHRDVKPANVMLDQRGWVTVTDFGIAKAADLEPLTGSGAMIGTPFYMSPEQCAGKRPITGASDQYSLGVMAYQMLSGRLPFVGESTVDIIKQQCFDQPPSLATLRPQLPPRLVTVVERALSKDPERRFASVTQFAKAFTGSVHGEPPTMPLQRPLASAGRPRRRLLWPLVIGVVLTTIVAVLVWRRGVGSPTTGASSGAPPIQTPPPQQRDSVASIAIAGAPTAMEEGEQVNLHAIARSIGGDTMRSPAIDWSTTDSTVIMITAQGSIRALRSGKATIAATSGGQHTGVLILVTPAAAASLMVLPRAATIRLAETLNLKTEVRDSRGSLLRGRAIVWTSSNSNIASVSPSGAVTGVTPGTASITARSDRVTSVAAAITVAQPIPSTLQVLVQPWAEVLIDGRSLGEQVKVEETLSSSVPHQLRFEREGYVTLDTTVTLPPGSKAQVTIRMKRSKP